MGTKPPTKYLKIFATTLMISKCSPLILTDQSMAVKIDQLARCPQNIRMPDTRPMIS